MKVSDGLSPTALVPRGRAVAGLDGHVKVFRQIADKLRDLKWDESNSQSCGSGDVRKLISSMNVTCDK